MDLLLEAGLISEDRDPNDGRVTVYSTPEGYIIQTGIENFTLPLGGIYLPKEVAHEPNEGEEINYDS